eukprot:NODE_201_length_15044_cov_0.334560.p11 type:complete len:107 gc:universal NODE_201_length_15044_cov_0.334560:14206-14526(+)
MPSVFRFLVLLSKALSSEKSEYSVIAVSLLLPASLNVVYLLFFLSFSLNFEFSFSGNFKSKSSSKNSINANILSPIIDRIAPTKTMLPMPLADIPSVQLKVIPDKQ